MGSILVPLQPTPLLGRYFEGRKEIEIHSRPPAPERPFAWRAVRAPAHQSAACEPWHRAPGDHTQMGFADSPPSVLSRFCTSPVCPSPVSWLAQQRKAMTAISPRKQMQASKSSFSSTSPFLTLQQTPTRKVS